ncbi:MAG TPA: hypothetical protein VNU71_14675 [Burkholderiaceae bacterium]|nr:hypothetical protein [Burkholderiaceae bacterium]
MKSAPAKTIKPATVPADPDAMTFADDGRVGLPPEEARAKLDAFRAKHPLRRIRKGQKGTAELVSEARESRDRR